MRRCESMDKLDFAILNVLQEQQANMELSAVTKYEILESLEMNEKTLFRRIKMMIELGYIQQGLKVSRSFTYFITDKGIKMFEEAF